MFDWVDLIVGSVIVGFCVNVISGLATPKVAEILERYSKLSQLKRSQDIVKIEKEIKFLASNNFELLYARLDRNLNISRRIYFGIYTILFLMVTDILTEITNFLDRRTGFAIAFIMILVMYLGEMYKSPPKFGYKKGIIAKADELRKKNV